MNSASQELRTVFFLLDPLALLSSSGSNFKSHIYLWLLTVSIQNLFSSPDNSLLHCWHLLLPFWSHRYILSQIQNIPLVHFLSTLPASRCYTNLSKMLLFIYHSFSLPILHQLHFSSLPYIHVFIKYLFFARCHIRHRRHNDKKKQKHKSLYSKENLKCCEEIKTKKASLYHVHSYFCA